MDSLASLSRQTLRPLEVIVVVDGQPEILELLKQRGGPEINLLCPVPSGLSEARNLGLAHASGAFVAFLDDDAVADESWLSALRSVLDDETVAGVSGVSLPAWEGRRPRWMPDELLWALGCSYRGMPATRADVRNVYGGCACIRATIFKRFGSFNPALGRMAVGLGSSEETELCLRVRSQSPGLRFVHDPAAIIHHRVPRERQGVGYMLARCRAEGRSKAALRAGTDRSNSPLGREASYLVRTVPSGIAAGVGQFLRRDIWGLARAILLSAGTASTVFGYLGARFHYPGPTRRTHPPECALASPAPGAELSRPGRDRQ